MSYYLPYDQLLNGSFFQAIFNVYDLATGGSGLVYFIFYIGIILLLALAVESPAPIGFFTILGAIVFTPLMPVGLQRSLYVIALFGIAITLYKVFIYKRASNV